MTDISSKKQKDKRKNEIEAISEKIKKSRLKFSDIIVPLASGLILILLSIFVFIPMIKAAIDFQVEYKEIQQKEEDLDALESQLGSMDDGLLQIDLINAKKVIPKTLKVSSFIYYIDNLAYAKGLSSKEISAGDVKIASGDESKKGEYILGVSGPLAYSGSLESVLSFLEDLYTVSPYVISAENITLKSSGENWKVSLNVTGYYVPESIDDFDLYRPLTAYTNYQNIVKVFEVKASQLD